jgi:hypothetical protein
VADKTPSEPCCDAWRDAYQSGSDNEAYGALVYTDLGGNITIGQSLPPVRFCPWCGANKAEPVSRKYDDLPLGARFRYVGHADYGVWVKLENGGTGVIAEWGAEAVGWRQSICCLCETGEERETFIVEVIE